MKRDMDLGRSILLELEGEEYSESRRVYELPKIEDYSTDEIEYHVGLLEEAGLLLARRPFDSSPLIPYKLTWAGHEFLDAARDQTRWNQAKRTISEKGGSLTFDVLKAVLSQLARQAVGL